MSLLRDVYKIITPAPVSGNNNSPVSDTRNFSLNVSLLPEQILTKDMRIIWNFGDESEYVSNNLFEIVAHTYIKSGTYFITMLVYLDDYFFHLNDKVVVPSI